MLFHHCEPIILASRSPRRRELLNQIGVNFELLDIGIDESAINGETAIEYVSRMAETKAKQAWQSEQIKQINNYQHKALLAADTSVVLADRFLGKPTGIEDAKRMLSQLSDNTHKVITSVALISRKGCFIQSSVTQVIFARLSTQDIADYCQQGEWMDKAGGYAIQGLAAQFVRSIEGSYSGVVGLPLYQTCCLLEGYFKE